MQEEEEFSYADFVSGGKKKKPTPALTPQQIAYNKNIQEMQMRNAQSAATNSTTGYQNSQYNYNQ